MRECAELKLLRRDYTLLRKERVNPDRELFLRTVRIHRDSRDIFGVPQIHSELRLAEEFVLTESARLD